MIRGVRTRLLLWEGGGKKLQRIQWGFYGCKKLHHQTASSMLGKILPSPNVLHKTAKSNPPPTQSGPAPCTCPNSMACIPNAMRMHAKVQRAMLRLRRMRNLATTFCISPLPGKKQLAFIAALLVKLHVPLVPEEVAHGRMLCKGAEPVPRLRHGKVDGADAGGIRSPVPVSELALPEGQIHRARGWHLLPSVGVGCIEEALIHPWLGKVEFSPRAILGMLQPVKLAHEGIEFLVRWADDKHAGAEEVPKCTNVAHSSNLCPVSCQHSRQAGNHAPQQEDCAVHVHDEVILCQVPEVQLGELVRKPWVLGPALFMTVRRH